MEPKIEKVNLCKCNNCGNVLIDHNPQTDAKFYEVNVHDYDELIMDVDKEDGERAWICPKCLTDSCLSDELN